MAYLLSLLQLRKRANFYCIIFFLIVAALLYANSMQGEFLGDDMVLIVKNHNVQTLSFTSVVRLFKIAFFDVTYAMGRRAVTQGGYYRPLCMLSYALDYAIWHKVEFGYHLTNVFLHFASTVLLFFFIQDITRKTDLAFIIATLFLTHPLQSLYIASLAGRTDTLCLVFFLAALLCYGRYRAPHASIKGSVYLIGALLSFFAALLAKEMALMFPFVIMLYDLCFRKDELRESWIKRCSAYIPFFLILLIYLTIRRRVLGMGLEHFFTVGFSSGLYVRLLTVGTIMFSHIKTMFVPFPIQFSWYYVPLVTTYWGVAFWKGLSLCIVFVVIALVSWRRSKLIFFGCGWFLLTYFPVSNIIPVYTAIAQYNLFVGKEFLHFPLVGFSVAVVSAFYLSVQHSEKSRVVKITRRILLWFYIGLICMFSLLTVYYNIAWSNPFHYYVQVLKQIPGSVEARNALGIAYGKINIERMSVWLFNEAIEIQEEKSGRIKTTPNPYINLVRIFYAQGKYEKAQNICERALKYFPNEYMIYYYLAAMYAGEAQYEEAIICAKKALALNPAFKQCALYFTPIFNEQSEYKDEIAELLGRVKSNPSDEEALLRLGVIYQNNYLYKKAITYYERVLRVKPNHAAARSNRDYCYTQLFYENT